MKKFDLNIQKVLEHWNIEHGLREIIANAIDESMLTNTGEPLISKNAKGDWIIRDFGRGLKYSHLTQNENIEKIKNPNKVIGKFGVGLKDALATFERRDVSILIKSKYSDITIEKSSKRDFEDVITLHAVVGEPTNNEMIGTEFVFSGLKDKDMDLAKKFFLKYSGEKIVEETKYGSIIEKNTKKSRIYVNGICVAEEDNLLFSYNITSPTKKLLQSLNRERTNVGRSAYSDRLKSILLECSSKMFADVLVEDLEKIQSGKSHDEMQWIDVQIHACKILNAKEKVLFLTAFDLMDGGKYITYAKDEGYRIVTIPDSLSDKLPKIKDIEGNSINDLTLYSEVWNENFEFKFVKYDDLQPKEKIVFNVKEEILELFPKKNGLIKEILISETMRPNEFTGGDALGLWEPMESRIIIKRSQLRKLDLFAGTLIHELIHAHTNTDDQSIEFENELTKMLGKLSSILFKK